MRARENQAKTGTANMKKDTVFPAPFLLSAKRSAESARNADVGNDMEKGLDLYISKVTSERQRIKLTYAFTTSWKNNDLE